MALQTIHNIPMLNDIEHYSRIMLREFLLIAVVAKSNADNYFNLFPIVENLGIDTNITLTGQLFYITKHFAFFH